MYLLLLSLASLTFHVQAQNQFVGIPQNFSFTNLTRINWIAERNSFITALSVRVVHGPVEIQLPLGDRCADFEPGPGKQTICAQWFNNGTATFGGPYASELSDAEEYLFQLDWIITESGIRGNSNSTSFRMLAANSFASSLTVPGSTSTSPLPNASKSPLPTIVATSLTPSATTSSLTSPTSDTSAVSVSVSKAAKKTLSTGAIIGIAIAGAALILISLIAFLLWRRHKNHQSNPASKDIYPDGPYTDSPPQNPTTPKQPSYTTRELNGTATTQPQSQSYPISNRNPVQHQNQNQTQNHMPPHIIPTPTPTPHHLNPNPNPNPNSAPQQALHVKPVAPPIPISSPPRPISQGSSRFAPSRQPSIDEEREMSAEELARLEDEERRIDEAIRESERAKGVGS